MREGVKQCNSLDVFLIGWVFFLCNNGALQLRATRYSVSQTGRVTEGKQSDGVTSENDTHVEQQVMDLLVNWYRVACVNKGVAVTLAPFGQQPSLHFLMCSFTHTHWV